MKRRRHPFTARTRSLTPALIAALALVACGGDPSAKEARKLDEAALSPDERSVAEALIEGFKTETGAASVSEAEIERAACYARAVDMPEQFSDAHKSYLADYAAIDEDFYPWFEARGVSMEDAWDIAERVKKGFEACSAS